MSEGTGFVHSYMRVMKFFTGLALAMREAGAHRLVRSMIRRGLNHSVVLVALVVCFGATGCDAQLLEKDVSVTIPSKANRYFQPDTRLTFVFTKGFDDSVLNLDKMKQRVKFMFDRNSGAFTTGNLIENEDAVVASLSVSARDPIPGLLGLEQEGETRSNAGIDGGELYNLPVRINKVVDVPGYPPELILIDKSEVPSFYIHCKPSGNDYPNFCQMFMQDVIAPVRGANSTVFCSAHLPGRQSRALAKDQESSRSYYCQAWDAGSVQLEGLR